MALEKYMAIAGLALSIFFVAEILTLFNFMIDPADNDSFGFEAVPKIFQFISLSIAPATIMIGVSFVLSKRYGSKFNGMLIIISGVIVLIGMISRIARVVLRAGLSMRMRIRLRMAARSWPWRAAEHHCEFLDSEPRWFLSGL